MKHRYILWLVAALIGTQAPADPRKEAKARQMAEEFLAAKRVAATRAAAPLTLAATSEGPGSPSKRELGMAQPAWYAYNQGQEAFVIVSGDDRMTDILGYSTEGAFHTANMPTNLKALLDAYTAQAAHIRQTGEAPDGQRTFSLKKEDTSFPEAVAPLLGDINYNQDMPYNKFCPELNGELTASGCGATAAAMIMRYYKYPERGTGSYSYVTATHGFPMEFDFGNTAFDWNNMLPAYNDGEYNEAQADAVATLMKACGVAAQMDYSYESSCYHQDIMQGMMDYLGYDPSAYAPFRHLYASEEWMNLIKTELSAKRPVLYAGQDATNAGHSFVIDGYDSDDLVHVNWGWGGTSNGYFELYSLNPGSLGIGGGEGGGYEFIQRMIIRLMPRTGTPVPSCYLVTDGIIYENGTLYIDGIANQGYPFEGEINIMAEKDGTSVAITESCKIENKINCGEYIEPLTCSDFYLSRLTPGTYRIYPAARQSGQEEWKEIRNSLNAVIQELYLEIFQDGSSEWHASTDAAVADIIPTGKLYSGCNAEFKVEVRNENKDREFHNDVLAVLIDPETEAVYSILLGSLCLPALSDTTFTVTRTLPTMKEGRYELLAATFTGNSYMSQIGTSSTTIDIEEADLAESFNLTGSLDKASYEQGETMTYTGSIDIEGHSGDLYSDQLILGIWPEELGNSLQYKPLLVTATKENPMHFKAQFKADFQPGNYCFIVLAGYGNELVQTTDFKITEASAIQSMAAQTADAPTYCSAPGETDVCFRYGGKVARADLYDSRGQRLLSSDTPESVDGNYRIAAGQLRNGIYLLRIVTASGTTHTLKFVR